MVNVTIIFGLLVVPYLIAYLFHFHNLTLTGRRGVCLVFLFATVGHKGSITYIDSTRCGGTSKSLGNRRNRKPS